MIPITTTTDKIFLDLRAELKELFYGNATKPGFSFEVIVRFVDKTQRCPCWDHLKKEAKESCDRCSGSGWLFFDKVLRTVKRKYVGMEQRDAPGLYEVDSTLFFFEHTVPITESDTIIEVRTDDRGNMIKNPVRYVKKHSIKDVEGLKGNNGRIEFYRIYAAAAE